MIVKALWAKKLLIIVVTALFTVLGTYYAKSIDPQFTASSVISVQRDELLPSAVTQVLGLGESTFEINTHIEIMQSPEMMNLLIADLSLENDPEFNLPEERVTAYSEAQKRFMLVERLRAAISIRPAAGASIIRIEARSKDPVKAATIANRLADIFVKQNMDLKYAEVQRVTEWMDQKRAELQNAMDEDANALREFQANSGMIGGNNILQFHNQEFLQLNAKLLETEQKLSDAQNRLEFVRKNMHKQRGLYSIDEVMNSSVISSLKREEARLQAEKSRLATKFGEKHPDVIAVKNDLQTLQSEIHEEVRGIVKNIENNVTLFEKRLADLKKRINEFQGDFRSERKEQLIRLQELQQDAETSRRFYENFLAVYQQAAPQSMLNDSNVKILSYAQPPVFSSYPNKRMLAVLSVMVGLFFAVFLALVLDRMNKTFRSIRDVENYTGFPLYSIVPTVKRQKGKKNTRYVLDRPTSKASESMRNLRMNLSLRARAEENIQIINFTSTNPSEGKSTISAWFAMLSAKAGERVLLIDCDMRRPKQHHNLKMTVNRSLVDYLTDRAALAEIIQKDEPSGLDIIPCKPTPSHALSLLTSAKLQDMLDELRDEYDLIILDAPAAATLSDPYVLSKLSDRTLYVMDYERTDKEQIGHALKQFRDIHYDNIGIVLNKVDFKKSRIMTRNHLSYAYLDDVAYGGT